MIYKAPQSGKSHYRAQCQLFVVCKAVVICCIKMKTNVSLASF